MEKLVPASYVSEALFAQIESRTAARLEKGKSLSIPSIVTAETWDMLLVLFGKSLEKACSIVDAGGVTRLISPCGRVVYQVQASNRHKSHQGKASAEQYLCLPNHFCSCHAFLFDVVTKQEHLACKHMIAVQLANALHSCKEVLVPETTMAMLFVNM